MKDLKTTIVGALLAILTAAKPLLDGSGYHFDRKTIGELTFAVALAALGYLSRDKDSATKKEPE